MASLTKRESGKWRAEIRRKGWPSVCKTFRVKRDAEDWARKTEDDIQRGIYVYKSNSEKMTLAMALERYLKEVTPTKKESTHPREIGRAKLLTEHLGQYSMAALNSEIIAKFRDHRLSEGKSNNTVRLDMALLSHLYSIAIKEWGLGLTVNPVLNTSKPSPGQGRSRRLNDDEEERLLRACDQHVNPFLGLIVRLALYTAMRKGEITSLTVNQVSFKDKTILLTDTKNGSVRTVPLSGKAFETIKEAIEFPMRPKDTTLIFFGEPCKDGTRKPYTINRVWSQALKRAEIEDFRFHDLRHEATSRLIEAGFSDQQVSSITGHKSMQMLKRYTHLRTKNLVDMLEEM